jgi:nicotinate-nucleotide--dimethylbenzimidazole phosphoribosyltransferase
MHEKIDLLFDDMAKPLNSLGILEKYGKKILKILNTTDTSLRPFHIIFSADNGIVEEGVAGFPSIITYMQTKNMLDGGATISTFCEKNDIPYLVVDIGIDCEEPLTDAEFKVGRGTKNFLKEPAMSVLELQKALQVGRTSVKSAKQAGHNLISFGEMGIGNTTTSSAVVATLGNFVVSEVTGYGALKDDSILKRKIQVIEEAQEKYDLDSASDPFEVLRHLGGLDIAGMVGGMLQCVNEEIPFVLDGFITTSALYVAYLINPMVVNYAIPSHMSREPGMQLALKNCGIDVNDVPLGLNLALGEGTGAILMISLLQTTMYAAQNVTRLSELAKGM